MGSTAWDERPTRLSRPFRSPHLRPPNCRLLELLRELPSRHTLDSILASIAISYHSPILEPLSSVSKRGDNSTFRQRTRFSVRTACPRPVNPAKEKECPGTPQGGML